MRGVLGVNQKHPTFDVELELFPNDYGDSIEDAAERSEGDAMDYVDRDANLEGNLKRWLGHEPEVYMNEWRV